MAHTTEHKLWFVERLSVPLTRPYLFSAPIAVEFAARHARNVRVVECFRWNTHVLAMRDIALPWITGRHVYNAHCRSDIRHCCCATVLPKPCSSVCCSTCGYRPPDPNLLQDSNENFYRQGANVWSQVLVCNELTIKII